MQSLHDFGETQLDLRIILILVGDVLEQQLNLRWLPVDKLLLDERILVEYCEVVIDIDVKEMGAIQVLSVVACDLLAQELVKYLLHKLQLR